MIKAATFVWYCKKVTATWLKNRMYIDKVPNQIGLMFNAMMGNNGIVLCGNLIIALG